MFQCFIVSNAILSRLVILKASFRLTSLLQKVNVSNII